MQLQLGCTVYILACLVLRRKCRALPPGPPGLPFIGNLLDLPSSHTWLPFSQWGEKWGGLVYLRICGQPFLVINSVQDAVALLERRSAVSSGRPRVPVVGDFIGWARSVSLSPYNARFREMRKLLHQSIGTRESMMRFIPVLEREQAKFLVRLWKDKCPERVDVVRHIGPTPGTIILDISYGRDVKGDDDPMVNMARLAAEQFAIGATPGAFTADLFPWLLRVPDWLPGMGWKRMLVQWRKNFDDMCTIPLSAVKEQMNPPAHSVSLEALIS